MENTGEKGGGKVRKRGLINFSIRLFTGAARSGMPAVKGHHLQLDGGKESSRAEEERGKTIYSGHKKTRIKNGKECRARYRAGNPGGVGTFGSTVTGGRNFKDVQENIRPTNREKKGMVGKCEKSLPKKNICLVKTKKPKHDGFRNCGNQPLRGKKANFRGFENKKCWGTRKSKSQKQAKEWVDVGIFVVEDKCLASTDLKRWEACHTGFISFGRRLVIKIRKRRRGAFRKNHGIFEKVL